ncbi:hypothetical protein BpHYR1_007906 [Brachionus plicatilis]|uniref:Uncharacterized protein n=1 Tax=Brachionus plicatilis TaxID=10195 RepID=A0A3M7QJ61_BRAPC|nr:hypothetical protein BpHYR1_007906 [Brachionus plicatilis]
MKKWHRLRRNSILIKFAYVSVDSNLAGREILSEAEIVDSIVTNNLAEQDSDIEIEEQQDANKQVTSSKEAIDRINGSINLMLKFSDAKSYNDHYYAVSNPVNLPSNSFKYYPPQLEKNRHAPYYAPTKNSQPFFPTNEHDNYITYSQCLSNSNPLYTNSHTVQPDQNQAPLYQVYDMPNPKKVYTIKFKNNQKFPDQYMDYFELQDYLDKLKPDSNLSAFINAKGELILKTKDESNA